jgi:nitroreductase
VLSDVETWDALQSRRNVRVFEDRPIAAEHLDRILEAGRRTPSSRNEQPWDFVVVTERERLEELAKVWQGARHVATSAATIAVVAPVVQGERASDLLQYDLGQVTTSLMLAAIDLGIGAGHAYVDDRDLASRILGLPDDRYCAWLIALGYPADRPIAPIRRPNRRPFDDVVHRERW